MLFAATVPVCSSKEIEVLNGQYFELNCSVHYIGSLPPSMKWSVGNVIDSNFDANITNISSISSMISTLKMYAKSRDNNATFKCTTYFNQPIITNNSQADERKAINAPTYNHKCIHRLNVLGE